MYPPASADGLATHFIHSINHYDDRGVTSWNDELQIEHPQSRAVTSVFKGVEPFRVETTDERPARCLACNSGATKRVCDHVGIAAAKITRKGFRSAP